jgi:hypothetical protein
MSPALRTTLRRALLALCLAAPTVFAQHVVVGSVDPHTQRVTIFNDILVSTFADGTPITRMWGKSNGTTNGISNGFQWLRAGKTASGACRTEVFTLVRLVGNRLAVATSVNGALRPWDPRQIPQKMFATFDCTSTSCFACDSGNPADPLGTDPNSGCVCGDGASGGQCTKVAPGMGGPYGTGDLVILTP